MDRPDDNVLIFDNLVVSTDTIGKTRPMKVENRFANDNARGILKSFETLEELGEVAAQSALSLKAFVTNT